MVPLSWPSVAGSRHALTSIGRFLLTSNPMRAQRMGVAWTRPGSFAARWDEKELQGQFGWVVDRRADGLLPDASLRDLGTAERVATSDFYVCHGGNTLGSGRSVFLGDHQVKGVGRTAQCRWHAGPHSDGRMSARATARDVAKSLALARWSKVPLFAPSFCMVIPAESLGDGAEDCFVVGRPAGPIRVAHLQWARAATESVRGRPRLAYFRRCVNLLLDRGASMNLSVDVARRAFAFVFESAIFGLAEARVLSIAYTNWPDNGDVFARQFDFEDILFRFPSAGRRPVSRPSLDADESPESYLDRHVFIQGSDRDVVWGSLQFLHNAFATVRCLAEGIGYDVTTALAPFTKEWLERRYRLAVAAVFARVVGESSAVVGRAATVYTKVTPLLPPPGPTVIPPVALFVALRARIEGGRATEADAETDRAASLLASVLLAPPRRRAAARWASWVARQAPLTIDEAVTRFAEELAEVGRLDGFDKRMSAYRDSFANVTETMRALAFRGVRARGTS